MIENDSSSNQSLQMTCHDQSDTQSPAFMDSDAPVSVYSIQCVCFCAGIHAHLRERETSLYHRLRLCPGIVSDAHS